MAMEIIVLDMLILLINLQKQVMISFAWTQEDLVLVEVKKPSLKVKRYFFKTISNFKIWLMISLGEMMSLNFNWVIVWED
jgi:hypothetical protein